MKMHVTAALAVAFGLGLVAGLLVRSAREANPPAESSAPRQAAPVSIQGRAPSAPRADEIALQAMRQRISQLEGALAAERESSLLLRSELAEARRVARAPLGYTRLEFPRDAPAAHREPGAFRSIIDSALSTCFPWMTLDAVDCTEYPCIAWMHETGSKPERAMSAPECEPLRQALGERVSVMKQGIERDGGVQWYTAIYTTPHDPAMARAAAVNKVERVQGFLDTVR